MRGIILSWLRAGSEERGGCDGVVEWLVGCFIDTLWDWLGNGRFASRTGLSCYVLFKHGMDMPSNNAFPSAASTSVAWQSMSEISTRPSTVSAAMIF